MKSINKTAVRKLLLTDPELQQHLSNLKTFISFFPPGKMQEELWQVACRLYDKHDETNWQYSERFYVYAMYKLLSDLCEAMQKIVEYFEVEG